MYCDEILKGRAAASLTGLLSCQLLSVSAACITHSYSTHFTAPSPPPFLQVYIASKCSDSYELFPPCKQTYCTYFRRTVHIPIFAFCKEISLEENPKIFIFKNNLRRLCPCVRNPLHVRPILFRGVCQHFFPPSREYTYRKVMATFSRTLTDDGIFDPAC